MIRRLGFIVIISVAYFNQTVVFSQEKNRLDSTAVMIDSLETIPPQTSTKLKNYERINSKETWVVENAEMAGVIAEDMVDFVQLVPAVSALDFGSLGQTSPLVYRGMSPAQSAVSLNGMFIKDYLTGHLNSAIFPNDVFEKINYWGAGVSLPFGERGMSGIMEIATKQIDGNLPYSNVQFKSGDWGYSDLGVVFGLPFKKSTHFMFNGSRQEYDGFFWQRRNMTNSRYYATVRYRPSARFEVNTTSLLNKNKADIASPYFPEFLPPLSAPVRKEKRFDNQVSLRYGDYAQSGRLLQGKVFISMVHQEGIDTTQLFSNKSFVTGLRLQQDFYLKGHEIAFGGGYTFIDFNSDFKDQNEYLADIFFTDKMNVSNRIVASFSVQLEKYKEFSLQFNPAFNLVYNLSGESKVWCAAQLGTRYPNFAERFWNAPSYSGNPGLKNENGQSFEFGYKSVDKEKLYFESTIFLNRVRNWIGNRTDSLLQGLRTKNFDNRTTSGLDFKLAWRYLKNGNAGISAAVLRLEEGDTEYRLSVPEYNVYAFVEQGKSFFADYVSAKLRFNSRFYGKRSNWAFQGNSLPSFVELQPELVFDSKLSLYFTSVIVDFSIENLFDKVYELVPGFPMPPRTFRFGINWKFWD